MHDAIYIWTGSRLRQCTNKISEYVDASIPRGNQSCHRVSFNIIRIIEQRKCISTNGGRSWSGMSGYVSVNAKSNYIPLRNYPVKGRTVCMEYTL